MAFTWNGMPCAICGEPIQDASRDVLGFPAWAISDPRFARFDDAAVHQSCIDGWHLRDEFVAHFNEHCHDELRVNRRGNVCYRTDWFNAINKVRLQSVVGFLLLPWMLVAECLSNNSRFIQSIIGLIVIGVLVASSIVASRYFGVVLGISAVLAIWLTLGLIAYLLLRMRSP